jgi:hypothetical protein
MWTHQYDQQVNQVQCTINPDHLWTTNGPESNLFGLEPNFGCCTANLHQGWPKFAASLWMASRYGGLATGAYAPSEVRTKVRGVDLVIQEHTEYPFRDSIVLSVSPASPVRFPLHLRIPAWARSAVITVNSASVPNLQPGVYARIEREWKQNDRVEIRLPFDVRVIKGFNDSVSVERGPLVYSLRMDEQWTPLKKTGPVTDWEVYPVSPWNYGLRVDEANPASSFTFEELPLARQPFTNKTPPAVLRVKARRLPQWMLLNDSAAPPPQSPVLIPAREEARIKDEVITLIPYGAARLRITSFPVVKSQ